MSNTSTLQKRRLSHLRIHPLATFHVFRIRGTSVQSAFRELLEWLARSI
jgi:hypothetical protein